MISTEEARFEQACGVEAAGKVGGRVEVEECECGSSKSVQSPSRLIYDLDIITRNVPPVSGIFMIYSWDACVFIGESDDICAGLLEIYYEANPCLAEKTLTHFSFESASPELRLGRQIECIREFRPACNLGQGAPECKDCRFRQWDGRGGLVRVPAPF
jgi:hypothetical protein